MSELKQMHYTCADGKQITLDVDNCLSSCPFCHTVTCHKDKENPRELSLFDKDTAERIGFPTWCPLEESTTVQHSEEMQYVSQ